MRLSCKVLAALGGLLLCLPSAQAQPSDSHELLPGRIDRAAAEKRLAERFQISAEQTPLGLLENLLKNPERYGINMKDLERIAKEVGKNPRDFGIDLKDPRWQEMLKDPKFQELARKLAGQANFKPEQLEALKKLIPDLKLPDIKPPDVKPPDVKPPSDKPADVKPPSDKPPDVKPPMNRDVPPFVKPPPPPPDRPPVVRPADPEPPRKAQNDSWIGRQLESLRSNNSLGKGLGDQFRKLFAPGSMLGDSSQTLSRGMRRLGSSIMPRMDGARLEGVFKRLGSFLPSDVRLSAPRFRSPINTPSLGQGVELPSGESVGTGLLVLVLLFSAAVALFALARSRGWVGGKGDGWSLGPWPVAPSMVRTREDVVKAFEYLALLRLGKQASAANHLDIASKLGSSAEDGTGRQRELASELAYLYEQARYAPPQDNLSPDEVETARRDLSLLAGVSAA